MILKSINLCTERQHGSEVLMTMSLHGGASILWDKMNGLEKTIHVLNLTQELFTEFRLKNPTYAGPVWGHFTYISEAGSKVNVRPLLIREAIGEVQ